MTHQPTSFAPSRIAERRRAFRTGCAMALALALAGNGGTATAQSFQGSGEFVLGGGTILEEAATSTIIIEGVAEAVIDWTLPTSAAAGSTSVVFQPAGTTATFEVGSGAPEAFIVLNRILPVDMGSGAPLNLAAQFDGTVNSSAESSVWFYSPSGIVVGSTATFNVGNLVLTSNDIDFSDESLLGPNGEIRFRGPANSTAAVVIQPVDIDNGGGGVGAAGTYLAIVAPRIVQAGVIQGDGQIALVAAEQANIRINAGLLDIEVTQGTTDPNGIIHTGATFGPASTASDDVQVMSLIAMPKNTALTMLLSGRIGYFPAVSAVDEGSSVVLSAGYADYLATADLAENLGNIQIGNAQFTSRVTGVATNAIDIAPAGGSAVFEQGADLTGFQSLSAIAGDGESIIGGQALFLNSNQGSTGGAITIRAEGGATGGEITAVGGLFIEANGSQDSLFPEFGESIPRTGGTVTLEASGGSIASELIRLEASGLAGGGGNDLLGGDGTGGSITASVSGGGSITSSDFSARARGRGSFGDNEGGDGFGGSVSLLDQGGALDFGLVSLSANGRGGSSLRQAGDGQGGSVLIDIASGIKNWVALSVDASATGGSFFSDGGIAGNALGSADAVTLHVASGATLNVIGDGITDGNALLFADAYADVSDAADNSATATAGGIEVLVDGGGTLRIENVFNVSADGSLPIEGQFEGPSISSPTLTGGTVSILADGGAINVHDLRSSASAYGTGATDTGGVITGGTNAVGAVNGGTISTFAVGGEPGFFLVAAQAYGGSGPSPADAFGGTATLYADGGTLDFDDQVLVTATAVSDDFNSLRTPGNGFAAQGGTASLELRAGGGSVTAVGINILADGDTTFASNVLEGDGSRGTGGTAQLSVAAGTFAADNVFIRADGLGGRSGPSFDTDPYQSGDGFGGTASFIAAGGSTTIATPLTLSARGRGGGGTLTLSGQTAPLSGNGTGGNASMLLSGGSITIPSLVLDARGFGGVGGDDFSGFAVPPDGGDGTGGSAQLAMSAGSTAQLSTGDVQITANGVGGAGGTAGSSGGVQGNGGTGTGGSAGFNLADGSFVLGTAIVDANGLGGAGDTGGNGIGGTAAFLLDDSLAGSAQRTMASLTLSGSGVGGTSETGPAATETAGQTQLTANAGSAAKAVSVTGDFLAEALGDVAPDGNGFVATMGGAPFSVGGNSTITTTRDVSMTIGSGGAFATQGTLTITTPRSVTSSGLVSSGSDATVSADLGITMSDLISGGTTLLTSSSGPITISNDLSSTGPVTAFGTAIDISSLGALTFTDVDAESGDLSIQTTGNLMVAAIDVAGNVTLASAEGELQATQTVSGNNVALSAGTTLNAAAPITGTGTVTLTSDGTIQAANTVSGTDIEMTAGGDISTQTVTGTGNVTLASTGGALQIGPVTGAGIALAAAGDVQTDADVLSSAALDVQAGGTFRAGGRVVGTDITAESGNIALGSNGSIGERGTTQSLVLRNSSPSNPTYIGGASQSAGYSLDAAEAARLFADDGITFGITDAAGGSVGDFIVGDLALSYGASGNIGSGGALKILTPGRVEVSGAVALTTSSSADLFSIDPTRIDIVTDTGSIVMRDTGGALAGQLELVGGTIAVASRAKLTEIANLTSPVAINAALDAPDANPRDAGYLQAGQILFDADTALYIANTGASTANADRRGFTANGVSIVTGSADTHISINGLLLDSAGNPVTGLDTAQFIVINGATGTTSGQFTPFSTINGCFIGQTCRGAERAATTKTRSDIEVPLDPEGNKPEFRYILAIEDREPDDLQPLVDEPVTGVGNDDLWNGTPREGNGE